MSTHDCNRTGHYCEYLTEGRVRELWDNLPDVRYCRNCGFWQRCADGQWREMTIEERVAYELMYNVEAPK